MQRTTGNPALSWLEPFVAFAGLEYAPLEIAHERMGDSVPAEIPAMTGTELFVDVWARYIGTLTEAPQTLLHGDPHIGNTYVLPDDTVGFLDWQMARRGNFSLDLGYFLQGALTIEDRRKGERDLVEEYRNALTLPADEMPSADEVWLRYVHRWRTGWRSGSPRSAAAMRGKVPRSAWRWHSVTRRHSSTSTPAAAGRHHPLTGAVAARPGQSATVAP